MAAACVVLAGCNTSGSGGNTAPLDLCGLDCPDPGGGGGGGGNGGGGGGGTDPGTDPGTSGGGKGTGGNTKLTGGDTTIALQDGVLVSPDGGSYSRTTTTGNTARFEIDTRQKGGAEWPAVKTMTEYLPGTKEGSLFANPKFSQDFLVDEGLNALNVNGDIIAYYDVDTEAYYANYDPSTNTYSNEVVMTSPEMQAQVVHPHSNNLNAQYREYRVISATEGATDEVLQVWNFSDSYATQYRALGSGGKAAQQAYSFGGTKTPVAEMPTSATATYSGFYGATAEASNWIPPDTIEPAVGLIDPNGLFMVNGVATIKADFGAATIDGTLRPASWKFFQGTDWYYYDVDDNSLYVRNQIPNNQSDTVASTKVADGLAVPGYFRTPTTISGKITGNTYSGKATLGGDFVSGDNPMYGAFFGAGAKETTGVFSVLGVSPQPIGGEYPINDDRRGYLSLQGVFNAKCQTGGACTP